MAKKPRKPKFSATVQKSSAIERLEKFMTNRGFSGTVRKSTWYGGFYDIPVESNRGFCEGVTTLLRIDRERVGTRGVWLIHATIDAVSIEDSEGRYDANASNVVAQGIVRTIPLSSLEVPGLDILGLDVTPAGLVWGTENHPNFIKACCVDIHYGTKSDLDFVSLLEVCEHIMTLYQPRRIENLDDGYCVTADGTYTLRFENALGYKERYVNMIAKEVVSKAKDFFASIIPPRDLLTVAAGEEMIMKFSSKELNPERPHCKENGND